MKITPLLFSGALAVAIALPIGTFAQAVPDNAPAAGATATGQGHRGHHGPGFMRAMHGINLSDQQRTQIKQIMQQFRQAHPAGSPPDKQAREQLHTQILGVLTPDQQTQFKANLEKLRSEHRENGGAPNPQASPNVP